MEREGMRYVLSLCLIAIEVLTVSLVKALSNVKVWILADSVCWVMTFYVSLGIQRGQWSDGKLIEIVFALLLHPFFNPHIFSPLQALHKCSYLLD